VSPKSLIAHTLNDRQPAQYAGRHLQKVQTGAIKGAERRISGIPDLYPAAKANWAGADSVPKKWADGFSR
jgi:hypothetical protein